MSDLGKKSWIRRNLLLVLTLCGVVFGTILGFSLKAVHLNADYIVLIAYPGELFMRFLKMIILPLLISCLIYGIASLNVGTNGKITIRTFTYFLISSAISVSIGLILVVLIQPGSNSASGNNKNSTETTTNSNVKLLDTFLDLGRNLFPDNLFRATFQQAFTNSDREMRFRDGTNTMGIVFFCLMIGGILGTLGERGKTAINFFHGTMEATLKIVRGGMWMAPIGVCSIIAGKIVEVENLGVVMAQLGKFVITVCIGQVFYQLVVLPVYYYVCIRKNPYKFYVKLFNPMVAGFATCSTVATLPITMKTLHEKVGINPRITRFVLPLACSMNTDGAAQFMVMSSAFLAQIQGIDLQIGDLITLLIITIILSLAIGSVPSGAVVLVVVILATIDVPAEQVTLLFTVEWLLDRIRTTNNILTDCYAAAIVEHLSRHELQEETPEEEQHLQIVEVEKVQMK
ncbi:Amino acid transporter [Sergentomyia squamirostris]